MSTLSVTSKGQVTLRKEILSHLGVAPGEKVEVEKLPGGRVQIRAARRTGKIRDIFGMLKDPDAPRLSIEEMNEFIADAWAGRR